MKRSAVVALGISQCVNWGVLYYAFAVLVLPLQQTLRVPTWVVTGAFSVALLASALLAPAIGRLGDRGQSAIVMQAGGLTAAALLAGWAAVPTVLTTYAAWAGLGACMAATLYEPAFAVIGRAYQEPGARLRTLAAITLFGGLASTVFLPVTTLLVSSFGWRAAVLALAGALIVSTLSARAFVFRDLTASTAAVASADATPHPAGHSARVPLTFLATAFGLTSLASAAFTANLVPTLGERGVGASHAALLGGLIGVMQLPGRALLMHGVMTGSPGNLLVLTLVLQALGLAAVAWAGSISAAAVGTMVFALGAGLTTLVRPHLLQTLAGVERAGLLNGRIARSQQLARAAGPLSVAWAGGIIGYGAAFSIVAGGFAAAAVVSRGALRSRAGSVSAGANGP